MHLKPILLFLLCFLSLQSIAQDSGWFKEFSNKLELIEFDQSQHKQILSIKTTNSIEQFVELKDGSIYGVYTTFYKKRNGKYEYKSEKQDIDTFLVDSTALYSYKQAHINSLKIIDTLRVAIRFVNCYYQNNSFSYSFNNHFDLLFYTKDTLHITAYGLRVVDLKHRNMLDNVVPEYRGFDNYYLGAQLSFYNTVKHYPIQRQPYKLTSYKYLDISLQTNNKNDIMFQLTPYFKVKQKLLTAHYTLQFLKEEERIQQKFNLSTLVSVWRQKLLLRGGLGINHLQDKVHPGISIDGIYFFPKEIFFQTKVEFYLTDLDYHLKLSKTISLYHKHFPQSITPYIGYQNLFNTTGVIYGFFVWF